MREYVLTEKEKTIIKKYLETGERLEGYAMLLSRCKRITPLKEDIKLIEQFLNKQTAK
jgi:hypothetical protein